MSKGLGPGLRGVRPTILRVQAFSPLLIALFALVPTEVRNQKSEIRSQKSEVRDQRSEIRSQRSDRKSKICCLPCSR